MRYSTFRVTRSSNPNSIPFIFYYYIIFLNWPNQQWSGKKKFGSSESATRFDWKVLPICSTTTMVNLIVRFISAIYAPAELAQCSHRKKQRLVLCTSTPVNSTPFSLPRTRFNSTPLLIIISQSLQFRLIYGNYALNSIVTKLWWFIHSDSRHPSVYHLRVSERYPWNFSIHPWISAIESRTGHESEKSQANNGNDKNTRAQKPSRKWKLKTSNNQPKVKWLPSIW